jgi:hypothetical protein
MESRVVVARIQGRVGKWEMTANQCKVSIWHDEDIFGIKPLQMDVYFKYMSFMVHELYLNKNIISEKMFPPACKRFSIIFLGSLNILVVLKASFI